MDLLCVQRRREVRAGGGEVLLADKEGGCYAIYDFVKSSEKN